MDETKNFKKQKLIKVMADFANRKNILLYLTLLCSLSILVVYQEKNLHQIIEEMDAHKSTSI